jgi:hypothetical protein
MGTMEQSKGMKSDAQSGFKQVLGQVWQTLVLLFTVLFAVISVYIALGLKNYCYGISPETSVLILCMFAFFAHVVADFIWGSAMPQVKSDYWCEWLANSVFFLFVIGGILAFAIFVYESYVFWFAAAFTIRVLPLIFGILLFTSFVYKIFHD